MSNLAFTGTQVLIGLILLAVVIIGLILFLRNRFNSTSESDLETYRNKERKSPLEARNKYPEMNPFRFSRSFLYLGLAAALLTTVLAFNWTTYEEEIDVSDLLADLEEEEIEMEPPRTAEPPPPPPPPPPPVIEEVPEEEIEEEEAPKFQDQDINVEEEIEVEEVEEAPPPPPPPPPPPKPAAPEIFKVVEDMPRFPGCEDISDKAERKRCAEKKMLQFVQKNMKYPPIAQENGIEGLAVIKFVVDEKGNISDFKIVKDVKGGCGKEALRVVKLMNNMPQKWVPGKQRGKPVKVWFNLPVRFRLE